MPVVDICILYKLVPFPQWALVGKGGIRNQNACSRITHSVCTQRYWCVALFYNPRFARGVNWLETHLTIITIQTAAQTQPLQAGFHVTKKCFLIGRKVYMKLIILKQIIEIRSTRCVCVYVNRRSTGKDAGLLRCIFFHDLDQLLLKNFVFHKNVLRY